MLQLSSLLYSKIVNKFKFNTVIVDIHEDILLQILSKLPVKSLAKFSCVCKLWYNLINKDQQFHKHHFIESKKKPILVFTFQSYKTRSWYYWETRTSYYLKNEEHGNTHNQKLVKNRITKISDRRRGGREYYNGLACGWNFDRYGNSSDGALWAYFTLEICNPSRLENLVIESRIQKNSGADERIYGFRYGYDLLNNELKVLCIKKYRDEYQYWIYTVGSTKPWKEIHNPFPQHCPRPYSLYSSTRPISCNGSLFYGIEKNDHVALVSFDLHDEKFQMIKLPDDDRFVLKYKYGNLYPLEYKGCLCYSSLEKSYPYNKGQVVLYILKDTVKHVWIKETIKFDLPIVLNDLDLPKSLAIVNFSSQVIVCWRLYSKRQDWDVVRLYNLHSKELKEVKHRNEGRHDYSVLSYAENFLSLKPFATTTDDGNTRAVWEEYKETSVFWKRLFQQIYSCIEPE